MNPELQLHYVLEARVFGEFDSFEQSIKQSSFSHLKLESQKHYDIDFGIYGELDFP